jgi:hypothetical protein
MRKISSFEIYGFIWPKRLRGNGRDGALPTASREIGVGVAKLPRLCGGELTPGGSQNKQQAYQPYERSPKFGRVAKRNQHQKSSMSCRMVR